MGLGSKRPDGPLFRVGRMHDAWAPPDWAYAKEDGTFGNRFDDPEAHYRVLYASSRRLGCFIETLARFRVDLSFVAELQEMEDDEEDDFSAFGTIARSWTDRRCIGTAEAFGDYADIYSLEWVSHLRHVLASTALQLGMTDVDLSSLQRAEPRILTQKASREVFELRLDGIFYHSRYGQTIENWAIFEPFAIHDQKSDSIDEEDPELQEAMKILGLIFAD
jgi:hypothetical protein